MVSVIKEDDGKNAMADEKSQGDELPSGDESTLARIGITPAPRKAEPGFFTVYKSGQGYWTRMGTVGGAAIIAILTAQFLYDQAAHVWFRNATGQAQQGKALALVIGFLAVFAFVVYRLINRPKVVEFLIATDSEMKKVNWTSRKDLIGSTKVVIVFMILIATILFIFDTVFAQLFHWIGVLLIGPFDS